jgi:thiol peroxidase
VCSAQTKRFEDELAKLGEAVACYTFSMDLPFLQGWFCNQNNITLNKTVSDHREASFGTAYGTLIKELRLLSRAVFVLDQTGVIRHAEYVKDAPLHPHYDTVIATVQGLLTPAK